MTTGKGGLSIIDYPFAFSIAALFSPSFVQGDQFAILMFITLIGGMFGSILTIVNPIGIVINRIYKWTSKNKILPTLTKISKFANGVVQKNFGAALKSPSISFEVDKLVGMFYFIVILGITIYRLSYDTNYIQIFNFSAAHLEFIFYAAVIGLLMVLAIIIWNVTGPRSISHLARIKIVTVLLVASDFKNLSTEGERILRTTFSNHPDAVTTGCNTLKDANFKTIKNIDNLRALAAQQNAFRTMVLAHVNTNENEFYTRYWYYFLLVNEVVCRYRIAPKDALWWFKNTSFLGLGDFDPYLPQLQTSIDSRDWHYADLQLARIVHRLEEVLMSKGGPL